MNKRINSTYEVDVITGAFLFGKRKEIAGLGGFDERFFFFNEETDLCFRFKKNGGKVYYFPQTSIIHLKGGTAQKNSWFTQKNQSIATIKFLQKHFVGLNFTLAIFIHYIGIVIRIPVFLLFGSFTFNKDLILRSFYYLKLLFVYPQNVFS